MVRDCYQFWALIYVRSEDQTEDNEYSKTEKLITNKLIKDFQIVIEEFMNQKRYFVKYDDFLEYWKLVSATEINENEDRDEKK